jgi:hypothetical protein
MVKILTGFLLLFTLVSRTCNPILLFPLILPGNTVSTAGRYSVSTGFGLNQKSTLQNLRPRYDSRGWVFSVPP